MAGRDDSGITAKVDAQVEAFQVGDDVASESSSMTVGSLAETCGV